MDDMLAGAERTAPVVMRDRPLASGTLLSRPNRFLAVVLLDGKDSLHEGLSLADPVAGPVADLMVEAHVADPGRLEELLVPGAAVHLLPVGQPVRRLGSGAGRRTAYDLVLVEHDGVLVSVDSRVPNELIFDALHKGALPELTCYSHVQRESAFGSSRLDFRLSAEEHNRGARMCERDSSITEGIPDCLIEVKSGTLVERGRALFPDAPTERGTRHMRELAKAARQGCRAVVIFVIQREDARAFSPNEVMDPAFAGALREAAADGVDTWAFNCRVSLDWIKLGARIPVSLHC